MVAVSKDGVTNYMRSKNIAYGVTNEKKLSAKRGKAYMICAYYTAWGILLEELLRKLL